MTVHVNMFWGGNGKGCNVQLFQKSKIVLVYLIVLLPFFLKKGILVVTTLQVLIPHSEEDVFDILAWIQACATPYVININIYRCTTHFPQSLADRVQSVRKSGDVS